MNVGDSVKAGRCWPPLPPRWCRPTSPRRAQPAGSQGPCGRGGVQRRARTHLQASGALSAQQIEQYTTAAQAAQARVEGGPGPCCRRSSCACSTPRCAPDHGVISPAAPPWALWWVQAPSCSAWCAKAAGMARRSHHATELARMRPGTPKVQVTAASGAEACRGNCAWWPHGGPANAQRPGLCGPARAPDLRAGMFCARRIPARPERCADRSAKEALVVREGFTYLFVLGADQRVQRLKVQPGRRAGDR